LKNLYARADKKERVWGKGIFARPRFSVAAEFRASFAGTTLNFYFSILNLAFC